MTTAHDHIADTLNRAQYAYDRVDATAGAGGAEFREAIALFIHHVTAAVLLEHVRRLDPDLANRLVPWLAGEDGGIFVDGYAGELLHGWREQLAAGLPLSPIGPGGDDVH